jgi:hypothetical protein
MLGPGRRGESRSFLDRDFKCSQAQGLLQLLTTFPKFVIAARNAHDLRLQLDNLTVWLYLVHSGTGVYNRTTLQL